MPYDSTFPSRRRGDDGSTIIEWENGERYQGEFFKNCFHGKGTYTWADKVSYSGFFYVNKRHGYGRQEFSDGRIFTGLYKDDEQYGAGVMEYPSNKEDVGFWKGEYLFRLCSSHPSMPSFQEVAIGYSSGGNKAKKTIDITADFRVPSLVDEYLKSTDIGAKLSADVRESLYSSSIANPDSMFFNRRLFYDIFQKSLAHEKKRIAIKAETKLDNEISSKMIKVPKVSHEADFLMLKPPQGKATLKISSEDPGLVQKDQWQVFQADEPPDYSEIKPDYPPTAISWSNNPQLTEIQKYCVYYQTFLESIGFPIDKLMSFNRESQKPPGEMESAANRLFQLAYDGDSTGALRLFLNQSVHPDVCDAKGNTPLMVASMQCHDEMINCLLDMGAGVNNSNDDGLTPIGLCIVQLQPASTLIFDCNSLRVNVVEIISECMLLPVEGPDRKLKTVQEGESGGTQRRMIPVPSRYGIDDSPSGKAMNRAGLKAKIITGTSADSKTQSQKTQIPKKQRRPLVKKPTPIQPEEEADDDKPCNRRTVPSENALLTTLKLLMSRGANVDLALVPANPIIIAIRANNVELLQLLLQSGTNPNIYHQEKDYFRFTPLHLACSIPTDAAVTLATILLEHGANPDLLTVEDRPPVTDFGEDNTNISTLPEKCVKSDCLSPLLIAVAQPDFQMSLELVQLLIRFKCNASPPLFFGHSPLSVAIAVGNAQVITALLAGGADPNRAIGEEMGPIVAVVLSTQLNYQCGLRRKMKIVRELIEYKADVVGPFKLGIEKRVGSLLEFVEIMYSKESKESKLPNFDEKALVIEMLSSYIQSAVRVNVLDPNRKNVALRNKIKANMAQKGTENIDIALGKIPANVLPMEMCYECCKSCGLPLYACNRCYSVLFCSRYCQTKAWIERHQEECFENDVIPVQFLKKISQKVTFDCQYFPTISPTPSLMGLRRGSKASLARKGSQIVPPKKK